MQREYSDLFSRSREYFGPLRIRVDSVVDGDREIRRRTSANNMARHKPSVRQVQGNVCMDTRGFCVRVHRNNAPALTLSRYSMSVVFVRRRSESSVYGAVNIYTNGAWENCKVVCSRVRMRIARGCLRKKRRERKGDRRGRRSVSRARESGPERSREFSRTKGRSSPPGSLSDLGLPMGTMNEREGARRKFASRGKANGVRYITAASLQTANGTLEIDEGHYRVLVAKIIRRCLLRPASLQTLTRTWASTRRWYNACVRERAREREKRKTEVLNRCERPCYTIIITCSVKTSRVFATLFFLRGRRM